MSLIDQNPQSGTQDTPSGYGDYYLPCNELKRVLENLNEAEREEDIEAEDLFVLQAQQVLHDTTVQIRRHVSVQASFMALFSQ